MRRRAGTTGPASKKRSRKAAKPRRASKSARQSTRSTPSAPSIDDQRGQLEFRTRERDEAREREAAAAEVLQVIASSPIDTQPVFEKIAESAARICNAQYCYVYRFEGDSSMLGAYMDIRR